VSAEPETTVRTDNVETRPIGQARAATGSRSRRPPGARQTATDTGCSRRSGLRLSLRHRAFTIAVARERATVISRMVASLSARVENRRVRHNFPWSSQIAALVASEGKISLLGMFPSLPHLPSGLR
jgi:hypothetical protein